MLVNFTVIILRSSDDIFYESVVLLLVTQESDFDLDIVGRVVFFLCWPCR
jgi:hypothetical protein